MFKKKPPGQIFPEEFYDMFTIKFWLKQGESKMNKLAWLLIIGIIGLNGYYIIEIDSKRVEIMNQLQSYNDKIVKILEYDIDDKIRKISRGISEDMTTEISETNSKFITDVENTLTKNAERQKRLMNLLQDKIDYFENNLDNTLNDNTEKIIETYRNDMSVLKNDIANINSEINDIDSLFLKLQGSWFTKRILK